jgi:hypothetical protein
MNVVWLKEKLFAFLRLFFGSDRLLLPALLFLSAFTAMLVLQWRLHWLPAGYVLPFQFSAAVASLVGYYVGQTSTSKPGLITGGALSIVAFTVYYYLVGSVEGVGLDVLLGLVVSCALTFGSLFYVLRILINLGLK